MSPQARLANLISRQTIGDGTFDTPVSAVKLIRWSTPSEPMPVIYEPTVCFVAQGRKQASVGTTALTYDCTRYLIASIAQPVMGSVVEASAEKPYLCLQINLDKKEIAELAALHPSSLNPDSPPAGLAIYDALPALTDAAIRLLALFDAPQDVPALAPLILREIYYRLLTGPSGSLLRHMVHSQSQFQQISRAISWIRRHFHTACRIEDAAEVAAMSRSNFHLHFRAVTSLSPLAFRLQLRMQEARRLMLAEGLDAASAGARVGYNSPSQFNRDYCRMFGAPPGRDVARLRESGNHYCMAVSEPNT
ncbi:MULTISPECIES: AraC family transcriptional regulator [unclassified Pseudomonas]|uniref:AraC family transcriptional regulator n=1 Tax=unclassified Pseudomonas TaxID=196821 RepID=UPI000D3C1C8E|nr:MULTISPECIES: AraC family transcriptional regulator [unclassified Pseudomonas]RAU44023.1 AraC family transcriptional regulator [Pseudomonas sp. RIT 409]RAU54768.1 AraC family transcriptional regulator [Pseudomonas sp. RIT 412]